VPLDLMKESKWDPFDRFLRLVSGILRRKFLSGVRGFLESNGQKGQKLELGGVGSVQRAGLNAQGNLPGSKVHRA